MTKKLIVACVSLVAFAALAIPSLASATTLTEGSGVVVPVGTSILATSTENIVLTSSIGTITCSNAKLTGKVTRNNDTTVQGTISTAEFTGTGTEGRCTSTIFGNPQFKVDVESLPYCIETEANADTFTIKGGDCPPSEGNLKFTLTSSLGNCTYEKTTPATTPFTGTFTTNTTPVSLKFEKQTFTRTAGSLCAATGELKGAFTLETDISPFTGLTLS